MTPDLPVIGLTTLQFAWGGLFDGRPDGPLIHLVRRTERGTPGWTLCGIDRFDKASPGWSVGGGISGPGIDHQPCDGCRIAAAQSFAGLPITGLHAADFARIPTGA